MAESAAPLVVAAAVCVAALAVDAAESVAPLAVVLAACVVLSLAELVVAAAVCVAALAVDAAESVAPLVVPLAWLTDAVVSVAGAALGAAGADAVSGVAADVVLLAASVTEEA